jgi:ribonuclease T2
MKFNYTEIESLQTLLDEYWPNYNSSGPRTYLWSHEWEKHGTCAYTLPAIKGELRYFNETLRQYSYLNTYQALGKARIIPSSDKLYKLDDIFSTLQKAYNSIPQIECYYAENKHYLDQIYLCYDKSLQPIDCPSVTVATPGTRPDLQQSLLFESENPAEDGSEPANRLNQYFVDCPKDGLVYYVPVPRGQAQEERRADFVPHIIES